MRGSRQRTPANGETSRPIEILRGGWGVALLIAPRLVLDDAHHLQADRRAVVVTRILGARQLTQALLSGVRPSPEVLAMGVWVDTSHAATALALAALDPTRARAGLTDAGVAGLWAMAGLRDLRRSPAACGAHDRRRDRLARLVLGFVPGGGLLQRQVRVRHDSSRAHPGTSTS